MFSKPLAFLLLGPALATVVAAQVPSLTIVNQASLDATVKLVGPSQGMVEVAAGSTQTVSLSGGLYTLHIRYCDQQLRCHFRRTDLFTVTQTPTAVSRATITLHSSAGNLGEKPISENDF